MGKEITFNSMIPDSDSKETTAELAAGFLTTDSHSIFQATINIISGEVWKNKFCDSMWNGPEE